MTSPNYCLERSLHIIAPRSTVYAFFTDSQRFAAWWGAGSRIDAKPGGAVGIVYPNGIEAGGEVLEVNDQERITFSFGYASGNPVPQGSTRVEVLVEDQDGGTRLSLGHFFDDEASRDAHQSGWAHQLAILANVAAEEAHSDAEERLDQFFELWSESDPALMESKAQQLLSPDLVYHDRYACAADRAAFTAHALAAQRFFPGARVQRQGTVRQCQGQALVDWQVVNEDGQAIATGTNSVCFAGDGKITHVTSFWN